ncbi:FAD-dependent oxidoreductase [Nocardia sp. 004]|uniref:FAD-dependent oxidoreductase n=1 Tax=Nocardia sp. 004 TaxID=3385978 RepID=UPI0039A3087F
MNANSTPLPATTSVVIVGAGPTGLTAAITLADADIDFVLLDRLAESSNTSRAAVVHARTLEIFEQLGIAEELISTGLITSRFALYDGKHALATIAFDDLPTRYPYILTTPQATTEAILLNRLRKAGGEVYRPYRVSRVINEKDGATVEYTDAAGNPGSIGADYVIGADGIHSVVREQAGIGFAGGTYPESFLLADIRMDWPITHAGSVHLHQEGIAVIFPLPDEQTTNRYRIVAPLENTPDHPTAADIQSILDIYGPGGAVEVREVLWSSHFRIHHRVADHYRRDRILLAGDAAHVHSPAGGQGMNTGIQDAAALGPLVTRVLAGEPGTLLHNYEATRRPVALDVVSFTDRMTRIATLHSRPARAVRNLALTTLIRIPAVRHRLASRLAELANS